jgi:hypothetical protein
MQVRKLLAMLIGIAVLTMGVSLSLAAPAAAASTRCKGSSCSNKDPQSMGCGKDARTIDKIKPGGGGPTVQLRRSSNCRAAWARLASKAGNWWIFRLEVKNGPYYIAYGSPNLKAYTRMSGSTRLYRACIKQYASDTWDCTRWH